jgi:hypothetical protein
MPWLKKDDFSTSRKQWTRAAGPQAIQQRHSHWLESGSRIYPDSIKRNTDRPCGGRHCNSSTREAEAGGSGFQATWATQRDCLEQQKNSMGLLVLLWSVYELPGTKKTSLAPLVAFFFSFDWTSITHSIYMESLKRINLVVTACFQRTVLTCTRKNPERPVKA